MKKAIFLDRDGVVNKDYNFVYKIKDFNFSDGIFEICKFFKSKDYLIVIITNQSGIARGYYTESDFITLTDWMLNQFANKGIIINKVYHCPHYPEITGECHCRKPKPGMILKAQQELDIDLEGSILVGDKYIDVQAAQKAGIKNIYLITKHKEINLGKNTFIKIISSLMEILNDYNYLYPNSQV